MDDRQRLHRHDVELDVAEPEVELPQDLELPPGKRSLTQDLPRAAGVRPAASLGAIPVGSSAQAPIQRKASGVGFARTGPSVTAVARAGIAGTGGRLPYLDTIQRAFGRHDVTTIVAHVGGQAAAASAAIGAKAYATGNSVAFATTPDLHTAAHEAAHVVQQRAGIQLQGGVGEVGDSYERHADAVADAVVAGASAESLLDSKAPRSAAAASDAVQRIPGEATPTAATPEPAPAPPATGPATAAMFEVTNWHATRNTHITSGDTAGHPGMYGVSSGGIAARADVRPLTPQAERYSLGFVQTLHQSRRHAVYQLPFAGCPVDNEWITTRDARMDQLTSHHPPAPWYNPPLRPAGAATRHPGMNDNPAFSFPARSPGDIQVGSLTGRESFTTYLVAMVDANPATIIYLANVDWNINWAGRFNAQLTEFSGADSHIGEAARGTRGSAVLGGDPANLGSSGHWLHDPAAAAAAAPAAAASAAAPPQQHGGTGGAHQSMSGGQHVAAPPRTAAQTERALATASSPDTAGARRMSAHIASLRDPATAEAQLQALRSAREGASVMETVTVALEPSDTTIQLAAGDVDALIPVADRRASELRVSADGASFSGLPASVPEAQRTALTAFARRYRYGGGTTLDQLYADQQQLIALTRGLPSPLDAGSAASLRQLRTDMTRQRDAIQLETGPTVGPQSPGLTSMEDHQAQQREYLEAGNSIGDGLFAAIFFMISWNQTHDHEAAARATQMGAALDGLVSAAATVHEGRTSGRSTGSRDASGRLERGATVVGTDGTDAPSMAEPVR